jgi:hypothetical protein
VELERNTGEGKHERVEMLRLSVEFEAGVALVSILNINHFCHLLHQVSL